jgi:Ala-tRNA(Pro) deacylase
MIPALVEAHLRERHPAFAHHVHATTETARGLAAAEHANGERVAKSVVLRADGRLAIAVVAANERVDLDVLQQVIWSEVELVPEREFSERFRPCEVGAEPPLAMFGLPIFVDEKLMRQPTIVMPGGTHEDAVVLDTSEWARCEEVRVIANLGRRAMVEATWPS